MKPKISKLSNYIDKGEGALQNPKDDIENLSFLEIQRPKLKKIDVDENQLESSYLVSQYT
jgi:hypothetical protein